MLVSLGGLDAIVPAVDIGEYLSAHRPEIEVYMDPTSEHGTFIEQLPSDIRVRNFVQRITAFLDGDGELVSKRCE